MKSTFTLLIIIAHFLTASAQSPDLHELLQKLSKEKNDSARFYLAFSGLTTSETNPVLDMANAEIILFYGQKNNDLVCQVLGLACLGYDYRAFGNTTKSLEYNLKARVAADLSMDNRLIAGSYAVLLINYMDLGEYKKALSIGRRVLEIGKNVEPNILTISDNITMGEIYLKMNRLDSALYFSQRAYEISMSIGINEYLCGIYGQLGTVHAKMGNAALAVSYFDQALKESHRMNSPKYINISYEAFADYYLSIGQKDSAILYAKKAISAVQHSPFATMTIAPAKLLLDAYRNKNIDSAFKYSEMHKIANDSLFNIKTVQQAQLMTFEEEARQNDLAVQRGKNEMQRKQNMQYALIAVVIIVGIIAFLLFSRSAVASPKLISFFGVVALLVIFEFLNLLLGPVLEKITGNVPWVMLLALVAIAALLVPIHNWLEKWTSHKLVQKNKSTRLAHARKVIEELEGN